MISRFLTRQVSRNAGASKNFATITRFSKEHEWINFDDQTKIGVVGITNHAQTLLGDIVHAEIPEVGEKVNAMQTIGFLESVKAVSDLYIPVSGTVKSVNQAVIDDPAIINQDAVKNWILTIHLSNVAELDTLMTAEQYDAFIKAH